MQGTLQSSEPIGGDRKGLCIAAGLQVAFGGGVDVALELERVTFQVVPVRVARTSFRAGVRRPNAMPPIRAVLP